MLLLFRIFAENLKFCFRFSAFFLRSNYTNIAQDCGVSAKTVKEYFAILEETMLGFYLPAYTKVVKRKLIQSPKFYYFDVAIPNHLLHRKILQPGTDCIGNW